MQVGSSGTNRITRHKYEGARRKYLYYPGGSKAAYTYHESGFCQGTTTTLTTVDRYARRWSLEVKGMQAK